MPEVNREEWDSFFRSHTDASFLQSPAWGDVKEEFGWEANRIIKGEAGAQILIKRGPFGVSLGYMPKGPLGKITSDFIDTLNEKAKEMRLFLLTLEANLWEGDISSIPTRLEFKPGRNIQPRRTILISLEGSEEDLLNRMKQKTRYNIRLAQKKDVLVTETDDIDLFYKLMAATGSRDGFGIHSREYYQKVFNSFKPLGQCTILLAKFADQALGALMVLANGNTAWYVYGASNDFERNRMPTYLLQWEAMRWARKKGCKTYDLWGIPDEDEKELEDQFETRSDGLWGVYRFKRGFGGIVIRSAQAVDFVIDKKIYAIYKRLPSRMRN